MDKMRDEFERWLVRQIRPEIAAQSGKAHELAKATLLERNARGNYASNYAKAAFDAWQHLYPMVEAAYREGHAEGFSEAFDNNIRDADFDWKYSTAKARLEGKDE